MPNKRLKIEFGRMIHYAEKVRSLRLNGNWSTRTKKTVKKTGEDFLNFLKFFSKQYDIDSIDNRNLELIDKLNQLLPKWLNPYFRTEVRGLERITPGAGLYVGNHSTGMVSQDSFLFCGAAYSMHGIDALPYGLGHETAIKVPFIHQIVMPLGGIRASHENAHRLFAAGKKALVYPGGDLESMRPFRLRNKIVFGGRRGYIRLVLNENVPIIPVVSAGAHASYVVLSDNQWFAKGLRLDRFLRTEVWPLTLSLPFGLTFGPHPFHIPFPVRILIEVLEPIRFDRYGPEAASDEDYVKECAETVERAMQECLDRLAEEIRERSRLAVIQRLPGALFQRKRLLKTSLKENAS